MKHSKHAQEKKINKKKIMIIVFIIVVITLVSSIYFISSHKKPVEVPDPVVENIVEPEPTNEVTNEVQETFETVDTSDMPTSKGGYGVLGRLVIDKIGVDNYVLNKYTEASLNLSVTWFWGPDENDRSLNVPRKYQHIRS